MDRLSHPVLTGLTRDELHSLVQRLAASQAPAPASRSPSHRRAHPIPHGGRPARRAKRSRHADKLILVPPIPRDVLAKSQRRQAASS